MGHGGLWDGGLELQQLLYGIIEQNILLSSSFSQPAECSERGGRGEGEGGFSTELELWFLPLALPVPKVFPKVFPATSSTEQGSSSRGVAGWEYQPWSWPTRRAEELGSAPAPHFPACELKPPLTGINQSWMCHPPGATGLPREPGP